MGKLRGVWLPVLLGLVCLVLGTVGGVLAGRLQASQRHVVARFVPPVEPPVDFRLRDQDGRVASPRDALGKVLVMTFLFTSCDDVCPAEAQIIGRATRNAGNGVEVYAVSVDPVGDTPARVRSFLRRTGLGSDGFRYLLGTRAQLRPVWAHFGIVPIGASPAEAEAAARVGIAKLAGEEGEEEEKAEGEYHIHSERKEVPAAARAPYPDTYDERYRGRPRHDLAQFEHSAYVLLIDKRGRQRVGFPFEQLDASLLRRDIRALLAES